MAYESNEHKILKEIGKEFLLNLGCNKIIEEYRLYINTNYNEYIIKGNCKIDIIGFKNNKLYAIECGSIKWKDKQLKLYLATKNKIIEELYIVPFITKIPYKWNDDMYINMDTGEIINNNTSIQVNININILNNNIKKLFIKTNNNIIKLKRINSRYKNIKTNSQNNLFLIPFIEKVLKLLNEQNTNEFRILDLFNILKEDLNKIDILTPRDFGKMMSNLGIKSSVRRHGKEVSRIYILDKDYLLGKIKK